MTADELKELAKIYCREEGGIDTVEITAFVEWLYRRDGRKVENMELLAEIEGKA